MSLALAASSGTNIWKSTLPNVVSTFAESIQPSSSSSNGIKGAMSKPQHNNFCNTSRSMLSQEQKNIMQRDNFS